MQMNNLIRVNLLKRLQTNNEKFRIKSRILPPNNDEWFNLSHDEIAIHLLFKLGCVGEGNISLHTLVMPFNFMLSSHHSHFQNIQNFS